MKREKLRMKNGRGLFSVFFFVLIIGILLVSCDLPDSMRGKGTVTIVMPGASSSSLSLSGGRAIRMPQADPDNFGNDWVSQLLVKMQYEIEFTGPGKQETLEAGLDDEVTVSLVPGKWTIVVRAIYVDDIPAGEGMKKVEVPAGEHTIKLDVIAGRENRANAQLEVRGDFLMSGSVFGDDVAKKHWWLEDFTASYSPFFEPTIGVYDLRPSVVEIYPQKIEWEWYKSTGKKIDPEEFGQSISSGLYDEYFLYPSSGTIDPGNYHWDTISLDPLEYGIDEFMEETTYFYCKLMYYFPGSKPGDLEEVIGYSTIAIYPQTTQGLKDRIENADSEEKIELPLMLALDDTIRVYKDTTLVGSSLNNSDGATLNRKGADTSEPFTGTMFLVESGVTLTLEGPSGTQYSFTLNGLAGTYNYPCDPLIWVKEKGRLITGVPEPDVNSLITISYNKAEKGGAVYIEEGGIFDMYDGSIQGNTAEEGGGVYINGGSFTMYESTNVYGFECYFMGNKAGNGGGVYVTNNGIFTMKGGVIGGSEYGGGNEAEVSGGGVYIEDGSFVMEGGIIGGNPEIFPLLEGNKSTDGGGVYVKSGNFTMSGDAIIRYNEADGNGGGVYITDSATFNMEGGIIGVDSGNGGNTAVEAGGGLYIDNGANVEMEGGGISGNYADSGGGVYIGGDVGDRPYGSFSMSGDAVVTGNIATAGTPPSGGYGVYVDEGARFYLDCDELNRGQFVFANPNAVASGQNVYCATGGYIGYRDVPAAPRDTGDHVW